VALGVRSRVSRPRKQVLYGEACSSASFITSCSPQVQLLQRVRLSAVTALCCSKPDESASVHRGFSRLIPAIVAAIELDDGPAIAIGTVSRPGNVTQGHALKSADPYHTWSVRRMQDAMAIAAAIVETMLATK